MGGQGWILLLPFLGFSYGTVSGPEAVITCLQDMAVVGETVEESGRHLGVAEDSGPLQHWQQRLPWLQPEDYASPGGNAGGGGASRTPCTAGPVAVPQGTLGVQAANWLCRGECPLHHVNCPKRIVSFRPDLLVPLCAHSGHCTMQDGIS